MGILGMFDKLDDLMYEPVKLVCDYLKAPKEAISARIETNKEQHLAEIEEEKLHAQVEAELQKADAYIELDAKKRRLHAEIDEMIANNELNRNKAIVDAIKQYQIDLSQAVQDCVEQIGNMTLELREKANNLVLEKTQAYTALQEKSKADAKKDLKEIEEMFADNERVRIRMEDAVIDQMTSMITTANSFIKELSEDIKRLNANIDTLVQKGQDIINSYLSPMAAKLMADQQHKQLDQ